MLRRPSLRDLLALFKTSVSLISRVVAAAWRARLLTAPAWLLHVLLSHRSPWRCAHTRVLRRPSLRDLLALFKTSVSLISRAVVAAWRARLLAA